MWIILSGITVWSDCVWSATYLHETSPWDVSQQPLSVHVLISCVVTPPGCERSPHWCTSTSPWIRSNHMLSIQLWSSVVLWVDAQTKKLHSKDSVWFWRSSLPFPSIPVFPPSHQVLFIDSEIAEEETEGETGIKTRGQSSAGLLPEERIHYPCCFSQFHSLFSPFCFQCLLREVFLSSFLSRF